MCTIHKSASVEVLVPSVEVLVPSAEVLVLLYRNWPYKSSIVRGFTTKVATGGGFRNIYIYYNYINTGGGQK